MLHKNEEREQKGRQEGKTGRKNEGLLFTIPSETHLENVTQERKVRARGRKKDRKKEKKRERQKKGTKKRKGKNEEREAIQEGTQ
ncbi:hypothetical protein G9A89_010729 [Geosiphon pyriformis]|nr:hypothetical protein G9A89_010729 [Geosiphon pyriformis]